MKITAKDIAVDAIFIAILAVMTFVPFVGMITLPFGSFTLFISRCFLEPISSVGEKASYSVSPWASFP